MNQACRAHATRTSALRSDRAACRADRTRSRRRRPPRTRRRYDRLRLIEAGQPRNARRAAGSRARSRRRRAARDASASASTRNCGRMSRGRADRHADADLPRPLGDRDEHDVHDPDAAHDSDTPAIDHQEQRSSSGSAPWPAEIISVWSGCEVVLLPGDAVRWRRSAVISSCGARHAASSRRADT